VSAVIGELTGTSYTAIDLGGEIDIYTAPGLREQIFSAIASGQHRVIMSLDKIEFMDSTGLGLLVAGQSRAREAGGGLWIVCTQRRLLRLFQITGLDKVFSIYGTVDEVIAANPAA
jgi:anti-sigma B factor antagonist